MMRGVWNCGWCGGEEERRERVQNTCSGGGLRQKGNRSRMLLSSGMGGEQFANAITVHLPSLTAESNQHCSGNSSA